MTTDELIEHLLALINSDRDWPDATKIEGEPAIGVETPDGDLFFLNVEPA